MSTYLVAFVIGEFEQISSKTAHGVDVSVFTPIGEKSEGEFALSVAVKTLEYFTEFFGEPYPLPKLDMIAIADFAAGAMENWGLVTYRSACLLYNPERTSLRSKTRIAYVVCHELAHQWFGNLVTMEWWTHLWLNEGFATWVRWLLFGLVHLPDRHGMAQPEVYGALLSAAALTWPLIDVQMVAFRSAGSRWTISFRSGGCGTSSAATSSRYGNFDIILHHFSYVSRVSQRYAAPQALCDVCTLLCDRAWWIIIGACDPMLSPTARPRPRLAPVVARDRGRVQE